MISDVFAYAPKPAGPPEEELDELYLQGDDEPPEGPLEDDVPVEFESLPM
jgi:hypothetical protein